LRNTRWRIQFKTLWKIEFQREEEFSKQFRLFDQHKQDLLEALARGCARSHTVILNRETAWQDLRDLADLYFGDQKLQDQSTPVGSRKRQLGKLLKALHQAEKLSRQALEDDIGSDLFRAANVGPFLPSYYGSSAPERKAAEIKAMVDAITNLERLALSALQTLNARAPADRGRAMLFPRDCLQGLGRIYYENTGAIPGRGLGGPFADFAHEFFIAVGLKKFSYDSLVEAIKDAHRCYKNGSWLGQGCRALRQKKP
jgi:hypothetical protein